MQETTYRKRCFWERPKRAWSQSCRNISSLPMSSTASIWLQFDLLGRLLRTGSKSALGFNRFCRSETGLKQVWNHVATTVHAHRADQTARANLQTQEAKRSYPTRIQTVRKASPGNQRDSTRYRPEAWWPRMYAIAETSTMSSFWYLGAMT